MLRRAALDRCHVGAPAVPEHAAAVGCVGRRHGDVDVRADHLEAFSHHPQIGADLAELQRKFASTAGAMSADGNEEQAGARGVDLRTLEALRDRNRAYVQRFGYIFIVCATGTTAAEMLGLLEQRLGNDPDVELRIAAGEQAKIAKLRLEKIA